MPIKFHSSFSKIMINHTSEAWPFWMHYCQWSLDLYNYSTFWFSNTQNMSEQALLVGVLAFIGYGLLCSAATFFIYVMRHQKYPLQPMQFIVHVNLQIIVGEVFADAHALNSAILEFLLCLSITTFVHTNDNIMGTVWAFFILHPNDKPPRTLRCQYKYYIK